MRSLAATIVTLVVAAYAQAPRPAHKVYDASADAKGEVAEALSQAQREQKRVLLVFGGNWCGDCLALDARFHEPRAAGIIEANFVIVHVAIGEGNKNLDLAERYRIPIEKGVPAVAVLEADGTLLHSQRNGEFEPARRIDPQVFIDFLNRWKPARRQPPSRNPTPPSK